MLIRLLISLVQLKAGNSSEKLKNEIKQQLYSLNRSKKLTKTVYRFRLSLADKLNLEDPNKNMALANLSIYYT